MLRLNLACEPSWLDLVPGVRLRVAPLTSAILAEARASDTLEALVSDGADDAVLAVALAKELGARLIAANGRRPLDETETEALGERLYFAGFAESARRRRTRP